MRRTATTLLALLFIASTMAGCALFKKKDKDAMALDSYDPALDTASTMNYPVYEPASLPDSYGATASPISTPITTATRYHTVAKKDTLYAIARLYYNGDQSRWKDIYEANRAEIPNPNMIRIGQRLVIP